MQEEREIIDCPYCGWKNCLVIDRWFVDREAMDKFHIYDWKEECHECGHTSEHYESRRGKFGFQEEED